MDTTSMDTTSMDTTSMETVDAAAIRRWAAASAAALDRCQDEINELNVFPIPDRDTGTNMALTAHAASDAAEAADGDHLGTVLGAMAHGAVLGARGNSGVILAQLWRGLADSGAGQRSWGPAAMRSGLDHAVGAAYGAVGDPVEGTILTVARGAADGAVNAGERMCDVVAGALAGAETALAGTIDQLAALHDAGVVDAGGRGLVVVLDALVRVVAGASPLVDGVADGGADAAPARATAHSAPPGHHETTAQTFAYEVQYLLEADDAAVILVRADLDRLGDSVVVVGTGSGLWNVHAHVDDVGAAIEAGIRAGRPYRIEVTRFADQIAAARPTRRPGVAIVAVAPGEGLADVFRGEGVHVVDSVAGRSPSVAEVLAALRGTGAGAVVLLPNADQVGGVAELAAEQARGEGIDVAVVPTRSPVQGLAAVAVHDASRRFEDDVIHMAESAAATRWAEVTVAAREALTSAGRCQAGDVLGLIAGEVVVIGTDVVNVGQSLIERLLGVGGELVTVLLGTQAPPGAGVAITTFLARTAPHVEVEVFHGGQPTQPLLVGIE